MEDFGGTVDQHEEHSLVRANSATLLLKNRKDFHDVYEALKTHNFDAFKNTCGHAGITDAQLVQDMWDAWLKISEKRVRSAGPIW